MALKQIDHGTKEYQQMVNLRNEVLRQPLGLSCMLTKADNKSLRLRQMAVQNNLQGKGIGASMLNFAETLSRDKGYKKLIMHARETAVGFYEKLGYKVVGNKFTEVTIPHFVMEKRL